ncbi:MULTISPECIES: transcriptional regulator [unclassified Afipia]|uniref:transcriptional regulator n=1 Tax=unclassified Afipia TaxID=2642050 RepID=UPI000554675B|nr:MULTISPECIES: transcriptional regulator [unclassified Afipia]OUX61875.1 MAG: transcriptional regulator [Afipia sp. TMED4]
METSVVAGVEKHVESGRAGRGDLSLQVQLLGALTISRNGAALKLPASRKVRALLAYLALAPHAVPRSQLCELLWDVPSDPRGELRWCLSKLRSVVDEPDRPRVVTDGDTVAFDLTDCFVDAVEIAQATQEGLDALPPERLRALSSLCHGEFLEGFEIDRNPAFNTWLTAQRRQFRSRHAALLERLAGSEAGVEVFGYLEKWLELAPFDLRVHENLLNAFARHGRIREGEDHLSATARLFDADGLDSAPIREAWRAARAHADGSPKPQVHAADLSIIAPTGTDSIITPAESVITSPRRASIAVMPFVERTAEASIAPGGPAGGLAHDLITRLAKLRSLFVIAQGTVFALSERHVGPEEAGRMLNVDYVVSGSLQRRGDRLTVTVELAETRSARVVWAEVFDQKSDDAFLVLGEIGDRIVASIANEIEMIERNRAMLKPPSSLDAWEAYHRGLWHMYRFNKADNERAQQFFQTAVHLDPTFSRAYGGLSFTHFQNAFQGWTRREPEVERAFDAAGQSLMADDRDPGAHWAMGRALWLRGHQDQSLVELEQAIDLSPNFALGHYTLAFVHSQGGDPRAAVRFSDHSRHLSPFDPLLFGMLGARAMALVRLKQFDEAAEWGLKAAARPNAHAHILAIAAYCLALAGRLEEARAQMAAIRKRLPGYRVDDFLTAMQFAPESAELFRQGARRIG